VVTAANVPLLLETLDDDEVAELELETLDDDEITELELETLDDDEIAELDELARLDELD